MFGRVRIHAPKRPVSQDESRLLYNEQRQMQQRLLQTTQFSANLIPQFGIVGVGDFGLGGELGVDWMSVENMGINYDWTRTFEGVPF